MSRRRRQGIKARRNERLVLLDLELDTRSTADTAVPREEAGHDGANEHDGATQESREEVRQTLEDCDAAEERIGMVLGWVLKHTANDLE